MDFRRLLGLAAIVAQLNACVSVANQESREIEAEHLSQERLESMFRTEKAGPLTVRSVVYKPTILPLGDFFKNLAAGRYKSAFRSVHFRYSSSNVNDATLKMLIRKGYIPVFIDVSNDGPQIVDLASLKLILDDSINELQPIPNDELPKDFESLSPAAMAANVYNTGVAIVGIAAFIAAIAALAVACGQRGVSCPQGFPVPVPYYYGDSYDSFGDDEQRRSESEIYNDIHRTTVVDYNNLLWDVRRLAPGESARGLLFFKTKRPDWTALRLKCEMMPR